MTSPRSVLWLLTTTLLAGCSGDDNGKADNEMAGAAGKAFVTDEEPVTPRGGRTSAGGGPSAGEAGEAGEAAEGGEGGVAANGGRTGRGGSTSVGGRTSTGGRSGTGGRGGTAGSEATAGSAGEAGTAGTTVGRGGSTALGGQTSVGGRAVGGHRSRGGAAGEGGNCDGCLVGDVCYTNGAKNPDNPCEACDAAANTTGFSNNDGGPCDDALYCTEDDTCAGGVCTGTARDCVDDVACNGTETCDDTADACVPGESTCNGETFCDYVADQCVTTCMGCLIDGVCQEADKLNPLNGCQVCSPDLNRSGWSDNDGARCNDDLYCNGTDTCRAGTCRGHSGSPCHDNGTFCDGLESCSEATDSCVSSGNPCTAPELACSENAEINCYDPTIPVGPRLCDGGNVVQTNAGGDLIVTEECVSSESHGLCTDGVCGCDPGYAGDGCDECRVYVDATPPATGGWNAPQPTVQAGIDAATVLMDPEITAEPFSSCEVWAAEGTYYATAGQLTIQLAPNLSLRGGFEGTERNLDEREVEAHETILSGKLADGDAYGTSNHVIMGADNTVVDGFTITDGNEDGDDSGGAGLLIHQGDRVTVTNCVFENNASAVGAGIYGINIDLSVTDCTFRNNSGSGIYVLGESLTVSRCLFQSNTADIGAGIVVHSGSLAVTDSVFRDNVANSGGGIDHSSGSINNIRVVGSLFQGNAAEAGNGGGINLDFVEAEIIGCTFESNHSSQQGGGLYAQYGESDSGLVVESGSFIGNTSASQGGGMFIHFMSPASVTNTLFIGNEATSLEPASQGGAILAMHTNLQVAHSTFTENRAGSGAAITPTNFGRVDVTNSVIWGNYSNSDDGEAGAVEGETYIDYSIVQGGYPGTGNIDTDPRFVLTGEEPYSISVDSPAVDSGNGCTSTDTDILGYGRVDVASVDNAGIGPAVDMGAYEYQGTDEPPASDIENDCYTPVLAK